MSDLSNLSELEKLIVRLKSGISKNASYVKTIRHPTLLISALEELNKVIGNEKIKDSVANQLSHLIMMKRRNMDNPHIKDEEVMLNTVLYGPPGVGKTMIATILAKIWYCLGYLDGGQNPKNKKELGSVIKDIIKDSGTMNTDDDNLLALYLMFVVIMIMVSILSMTWSFYNKFGGQITLVAIVVIMIIFLSTSYFIYSIMNTSQSSNQSSKNININKTTDYTENNKTSNNKTFNNIEHIPSDDQIIKVVSRQDFVGKYVGWSDKQTIKLLEENLGKVLFIDEAYSLANDATDSFGVEALSAINLFLSQNAGKIIVIMAGYKDLMENGIFAIQPGLRRRFMWQFEAEGYTGDELFKIFKIKLANKGWSLTTEDNVRQLFNKYRDIFINQGGDVERLVFFCSLEHSKDFINDEHGVLINNLNISHIKKGLIKLQENNIQSSPDEEPSTNPLANMMKAFRGNKQKAKPKNPKFDKSELFDDLSKDNNDLNNYVCTDDSLCGLPNKKYNNNQNNVSINNEILNNENLENSNESLNNDEDVSELLMNYFKANQQKKAFH
jgi:hypothetical protein